MGFQEDYHTRDCNTGGGQSEEEAVAAKIGDNCQEHRETESSDHKWNKVELCPNLTISVFLYDGWSKICKACKDYTSASFDALKVQMISIPYAGTIREKYMMPPR